MTDTARPCASYATVADVQDMITRGYSLGVTLDGGPSDQTAILEDALVDASRRLYIAGGGRWPGECSATFRPCRWRDQAYAGDAAAGWFGCGCAGFDPCSCTDHALLRFPVGPVRGVTRVVIDGTDLPPEAWTLRPDGLLARTDGEDWPDCQNIELDLTQPETWGVEFSWGEDLPPGGAALLIRYAAELVKGATGGPCAIADGYRVISRPGLEVAVDEDPTNYRAENLTGFGPLDDWLTSERNAATQPHPRAIIQRSRRPQ